ncbi:ThuA domain-containing protein, partial [Akkermansiaceae bacterium]|nr:ThuA domain-containing protein [Akkermansiaceae bacterium]
LMTFRLGRRMLGRRALIGILAIFGSLAGAHEKAGKPDRGPKHTGQVLVFGGTGWYRHPETAAISGWLARLGPELKMQVDVTENPNDVEKLLDRYDVLILNNSNELVKLFDEKQRKKVEDWYAAGGGIVALHAALVRQTEWEWLSKLGGCDFNSDSEYLEAKVMVDPKAMDHPTVKGHGESFMYTADWTNHDKSVTGVPGIQVLLRVDESTYDPVRDYFKTRGGKAMGKDHPVAWINTLNDGRFFYTELGHDVRSLETPFGRQHIIEGIRWAARVDAKKVTE